MLVSDMAAAAGTCPQCPSGCVPEASVAQFIPALSSDVIRACPGGCVPVETVKTYKMPPPCLTASAAAGGDAPVTTEAPGADAAVPPGDRPLPPDAGTLQEDAEVSLHDASRASAWLGPAVQEKIPGQLSVVVHELQILELQYNLNQYVQLGAVVTLPVIGLGGIGTLRLSRDASEHVALGFGVFGGGLSAVGSMTTDNPWWFAGAHAGISFFSKEGTILNIGVIASAVEQMNTYKGTAIVPVPYLGLIAPVSTHWAFVGELIFPVTEFGGSDSGGTSGDDGGFSIDIDLDYENPFMFYYGFRFTRRRIYGDLGFIIPMQSKLIGLLIYCPPGFPYISFGVRI